MESQKTQKDIIVFAGPSGVGKSTLCNILLHYSNEFEFSVSATTRDMRLGEKNGQNYYFFSNEEFTQRIANGDFIEWEEVYPGCFYGTLASEISRIIAGGKKAVFDVDVKGALNLKKKFGERAFVIFVKPESTQALEERLRSRGTENEEEIKTRVARFENELTYENKFDQILVNKTGDIEGSKQRLLTLVKEHFGI